MPLPDLPPYLLNEESFSEWARSHGYDETDEAFALFERWLDGERGMPFSLHDTREEQRGEK